MASKVLIQNPINGLTNMGYFGFSWTYLFFGGLVPLFRGEIGIGCLHILLSFITFGISNIIFSFLYNKQYMTRMIEKGYVLKDSESVMYLARKKLGIEKV